MHVFGTFADVEIDEQLGAASSVYLISNKYVWPFLWCPWEKSEIFHSRDVHTVSNRNKFQLDTAAANCRVACVELLSMTFDHVPLVVRQETLNSVIALSRAA